MVIVQPVTPIPTPKKVEKKAALPTQATIVVELPDDARLFIDGQFADLTSVTRSFITPELELGSSYGYTLKAEVVRNGQTVSREKQIVFQAGQTTRVRFDELLPAPARVTVRLPEDAKLFVDGVPCSVKAFDTPKLEAGQKFFYTLRAEVVRDGRPVVETRRVVLEAGKRVDVEFPELTAVSTAQR